MPWIAVRVEGCEEPVREGRGEEAVGEECRGMALEVGVRHIYSRKAVGGLYGNRAGREASE